MDLQLFKNFLVSLSQVFPVSFDFRDLKGSVLFSGNKKVSLPILRGLESVAGQVTRQESFQYLRIEDKYDLFGVPVLNNGRVVGVLTACDTGFEQDAPGPQIYPAHHMEQLLTHLAGLIEDKLSSMDESEKLANELAKSFEDLNLYARIAPRIKTLRFSPAKLEELNKDLLESMRAQMGFAFMPHRPEYNSLITVGGIDQKIAHASAFIETLINAIPPDAPSLVDNYFIVNNSSQTPGYQKMHAESFRFLGVRIRHGGKFYGWLGMVSFNLKEIFRQGEMSMLISVAEQVALVISNSDLYRDLEAFVISVGKSLVCAIEAKDAYTRGHSERVNRYCMLMAAHLDLDAEQQKVLNWASILHDIGKIGTPENILNKPDKLTDDEYDIVKAHPLKGYNILRPLDQLAESLPGILYHHERYDGGGYPRGFQGEEIPLYARVIAIADTFDAISSKRAYRSAKPGKEAMKIIKEVAGSQLDPGLVEVFETVFYASLEQEE